MQLLTKQNEAFTWPYTFAKVAGGLSIVLGGSDLIGWLFYIWLPSDVQPYILILKPNSALCMMLIGIALWVRAEKDNSYTSYAAQIASGTVFLISMLTLFEYFFGVDLGIDQGLFRDRTSVAETFLPAGRMSPFTAINFVLLSFTLFFLDSKTIRYHVHQLFVILVFINSYFQLLGTIYNIGSISEVFGLHRDISQVGIVVIATFIMLGMGVLFARPNRGIIGLLTSQASGGVLARRVIPPALILSIVFGYFEIIGQKSGSYESQFGTSLLVMGITVFFTAIILLNAYFVNRVDEFRRQAETALMQSQMKLQAIIDNTNLVISIFDIGGNFLLVNKEFEKLYNVNSTEVTGKSIYDVLPKQYADQIFENHFKVVQSRTSVAVEEIIPVNFENNVYLSNKFPIYDSRGSAYAICNISTNVTEIKKMHEILSEREHRLSVALKSARAGTWTWDIKRDVIVWDEFLHILFGLKPGSFPGYYEAQFNYIHPDDRKRVHDEVQGVLEGGDDYESEFRIIHSDGTIRYIATKGHLFRDEDGQAARMAGVCWDTTDRKREEEELRNAKEVAEQLAEEAEAGSRAKSAFLAAMSHEIRTPLNGVIGMTGLLLDTPLTSEQREYVETVRVSGEALLTVINDILDFSKIESERMELENIDFNVHTLVEDTADIFAASVHKKGVALGAYIEPEVPTWLNGDPGRIRQVLTNILSNAIKFTDSGEIGIKVTLVEERESHERDGKDVMMMFEVTDTGIGINAEVRQRLFQPFSQGDVSTSRKYGGTGLGLAISKRLVELMGGHIDVDSMPGHGSKFWFTVKLTESKEAAPVDEFKTIKELEGVRLLCVDDNAINREVVKHQTEAWKMRSDVAINAAEALSMLKKASASEDPYSLIITDNIMPGMTGIEMIQIMRQLKDINTVPVILLSSLGSTYKQEDLKEIGVTVSLNKPLRMNRLYDAILAVVKHTTEKMTDTVIMPEDANIKERAAYRILLAEDNPINKQVATKIIERLGYHCDSVGNGLEVLQVIRNIPYDLILMDCQMPEMDGYIATEEVRKSEMNHGTHIPIIAMTAHALKGDREKCLAAGMDDYLSKPVNINAISDMLEKWLPSKANRIIKKVVTDAKSEAEALTSARMSIIDMERIQAIFGDDKAQAQEFMKIFIESTADLLKDIKIATTKKNVEESKELFHRLKGSAGNSGVMQIHSLCVVAEENVKKGAWDAVESGLKSINNTFKKMKAEAAEKFDLH